MGYIELAYRVVSAQTISRRNLWIHSIDEQSYCLSEEEFLKRCFGLAVPTVDCRARS